MAEAHYVNWYLTELSLVWGKFVESPDGLLNNWKIPGIHLHVVELHNTGANTSMTLAAFVALCSAVLGKPIQQQMVVLGSMSLVGVGRVTEKATPITDFKLADSNGKKNCSIIGYCMT